MLRLTVRVNEQGRLVIPKVIRDLLGIEIGGTVEIQWGVDEDDFPYAVIRPRRMFCEICTATTGLQYVPGTRRTICGACRTELISEFASFH